MSITVKQLQAQVNNSYKNTEKLVKKLDDEITRRTAKMHKDREILDGYTLLRENLKNAQR